MVMVSFRVQGYSGSGTLQLVSLIQGPFVHADRYPVGLELGVFRQGIGDDDVGIILSSGLHHQLVVEVIAVEFMYW